MPSIFRPGLFDGQTAIVTGGASGIGLCTAKILGELGARVAICGRNPQRLEAGRLALAGRGIEVHAATCDIRNVEEIAFFVAGVSAAFGPADILVNNAGGQFPVAAAELSPRGWEAVIRNNLNGTFFMTQAVAKQHMLPARRGRIVNVIANIVRGFPGMVHTGAARAGVENMTRTLAIEWAPFNVQVNAVAPGLIRTSGTAQYPPELVESGRLATPQKRFGTPEETAQLIVYLASFAASFITGVTSYIDGGAHLWGDQWKIADIPEPEPPQAVRDLAEPAIPAIPVTPVTPADPAD